MSFSSFKTHLLCRCGIISLYLLSKSVYEHLNEIISPFYPPLQKGESSNSFKLFTPFDKRGGRGDFETGIGLDFGSEGPLWGGTIRMS